MKLLFELKYIEYLIIYTAFALFSRFPVNNTIKEVIKVVMCNKSSCSVIIHI